MEKELLDVYTSDGKSLGIKKLRAEVHNNGDWHKVVHIYIVNNQGQYLVHLRSPLKDLSPNCWDTRFGGHVKSGDNYDQTVTRELNEELGITVKEGELIPGGISSHDGEKNKELIKYYYYKFNGNKENLSFDDNEVIEVKWLSPEEIIKSMTDNKEAWAASIKSFTEVSGVYNNLHK